jgi:DNA-binding transcriptional ArsR family regulator
VTVSRKRSPQPRVLTDARAIRALAHPARLAVLDALSGGGELTATECADIAGITPSAMSYHLRALEKWGFVERAPASGDGRERPWRSLPGGWRIDAASDHAMSGATSAMISTLLDRLRAELTSWALAEPSQPKAWRDVTTVERRMVWMSPGEARELERLVADYLEPMRGRSAEDSPEGARRVRIAHIVVPLTP